MKERKVKTRKEHDCSYCEEKIPKGEECYFFIHRGPEFEKGHDEALGWFDCEKQIGVHYIRGYIHLYHKNAPASDKAEK